MAADEPAKSKAAAFFTRYEVVAVAVPGGMLLFGLLALAHDLPLPSWLYTLVPKTTDFTKIDLGSLGLFTVAAFCAGQVIQAVAAAIEWQLGSLVWSRGPAFKLAALRHERGTTPNLGVPRRFRPTYASLLDRIEFEPNELSQRDYFKEVFPFVLARLYRAGISDRLLDIRVSWGLHRALAVTFSIFTVLLVSRALHHLCGWVSTVLPLLALAVTLAMIFNAQRYRAQYYQQVAFEYIYLEKAWGRPEA